MYGKVFLSNKKHAQTKPTSLETIKTLSLNEKSDPKNNKKTDPKKESVFFIG